MEVNDQLDAPATLPRMKVPWYSLNMRLHGPQRRPNISEERKTWYICDTDVCIFITGRYCRLYYLRMLFSPLWGAWAQCRASRSHSDTPHSVGLFWTNDQPDAETSTWQHTSLTTDRESMPRRDSNPQPQQASGRRSARPLGSASLTFWHRSFTFKF